MSDKEAYRLIGERAEALAQSPEIQAKMIEIAKEKCKEEAEKWLYMVAVGTLAGLN